MFDCPPFWRAVCVLIFLLGLDVNRGAVTGRDLHTFFNQWVYLR